MSNPSFNRGCDDFGIIDQGSHVWRTEIPNIVFFKDLDPLEFRLYAELKKVAGDTGRSFKGTRRLAEDCKMSVGAVSKAKKSLQEKGLILVRKGNQKLSQSDTIFILDVWQENREGYQELAEKARSQNEAPYSRGEHPASSGEHKKIPIKNNQGKKEDILLEPSEFDEFGGFDEVDSLPSMPSPSSSFKTKTPDPTAEEIYQAYPKKAAKIAALKAVQKLIDAEKIPAPELFEIVKNYAKAIAWKDQQFIPYLASWINAGQYEDDPKQWEKPVAKPRPAANGKFVEKPPEEKNYDDQTF